VYPLADFKEALQLFIKCFPAREIVPKEKIDRDFREDYGNKLFMINPDFICNEELAESIDDGRYPIELRINDVVFRAKHIMPEVDDQGFSPLERIEL
jgi:hypothetical protein